MNQTSIIAASLVIGFIVFVTTRGELPAYLAVFGIGQSNMGPNVGTLNQNVAAAQIGQTVPGAQNGLQATYGNGIMGTIMNALVIKN